MDDLRGGTFSPNDGYASPLMAGSAFHSLALEAGVSFFFNSRIERIRREGNRVASISVGDEEFAAGLFVNAAGAKAADIAKVAGFDIPVFPDCHEAGVTEPVERFLEPMIVDIRSDAESAITISIRLRPARLYSALRRGRRFGGGTRTRLRRFCRLPCAGCSNSIRDCETSVCAEHGAACIR
jgi:glycine/D-amino acid oxidase-like deaminating enzyme